jgi:hypothetical protein
MCLPPHQREKEREREREKEKADVMGTIGTGSDRYSMIPRNTDIPRV